LSAPQGAQPSSFVRTKSWCKCLVLAIFVVWAIQDALLPALDSPNLLDLLLGVAMALLCLRWCSADAAERQEPFSSGWKWFVFLLGLGGLTIYVLVRRPATTFLKGIGLALLAGLSYTVAYMFAYRLYEGTWPDF
jgi:ABC-type transport system involved in cytochrome c biogenesis permease subunit